MGYWCTYSRNPKRQAVLLKWLLDWDAHSVLDMFGVLQRDLRTPIVHVNSDIQWQWTLVIIPHDITRKSWSSTSSMRHPNTTQPGSFEKKKVSKYSDLGNCDATDLIQAISELARQHPHPSCFHVDEHGCVHSEQVK